MRSAEAKWMKSCVAEGNTTWCVWYEIKASHYKIYYKEILMAENNYSDISEYEHIAGSFVKLLMNRNEDTIVAIRKYSFSIKA